MAIGKEFSEDYEEGKIEGLRYGFALGFGAASALILTIIILYGYYG